MGCRKTPCEIASRKSAPKKRSVSVTPDSFLPQIWDAAFTVTFVALFVLLESLRPHICCCKFTSFGKHPVFQVSKSEELRQSSRSGCHKLDFRATPQHPKQK